MKSLGKIGFPGIVKAFKLVSVNDIITVCIAVRVIESKDGEELVSRNL
jgi:hypothetical protein